MTKDIFSILFLLFVGVSSYQGIFSGKLSRDIKVFNGCGAYFLKQK